jgi:tRNA U34 5-carboxymethylaminomethyl modifying GTPase MnmE/TrmE
VSDPVVRELTAPERGGVAVLEVRGRDALERVRALCPDASLGPGHLVLARIATQAERLDEALVVVLDPERVELHLHGNPSLVRAVAARLGPPGPTERDLEARAARLCASAPSEAGARILLDQAEGALRRELEALCAAPPLEQDRRLDALLSRTPVVRRTLRPSLVLILGPPNAGKSTLFNALVGARRVLVSAEVGTTRDVVVERARLGAYPVDLADAPGERGEAPAAVGRAVELEREGGRIARALLEAADLVLWLSPAHAPAAPPTGLPAARLAVVTSQADRLAGGPGEGPSLAALRDPAAAADCVEGLLRARLDLPADPWVPGAPALFERESVELARRARAASGGRRRALLASLSGETAPEVEPGGERR